MTPGPSIAGAADPRWRDPARTRHLKSAPVLVNRERARALMARDQLDGLVASTAINVYYLSSHRGPMQMMGRSFSFHALFPKRNDAPAALVVPGSMLYHLDYRPTWMPSVQVYSFPLPGSDGASPYVSPWASYVREGDLREADRVLMAIYADYQGRTSVSALAALQRAILEAGLAKGRLGFDDPRVLPWLQGAGLPDLRGMDALNLFREIRMVKTEPEIEILREAAIRNESALDAAIATIEVGQPLAQIEAAHARAWGELGGSARWLVANVRGLNSGVVASGDFMKLDSVGEYLGYLGDVGRTVSCGPPTDELARRIEANTRASRLVYEAIRPGMRFSRSTRMFAECMREQGFDRGPAAPHPVGLEHTDQPWPTGAEAPGSVNPDLVFEEGMVFTLDMPYHEVGWGTTHVEDMMVVRADGAKPLSSMDTRLRIRPG